MLKIGVLALQGDVREHIASLHECGATPITVRRPAELAKVSGLILPGGESTTIAKLAHTFALFEPLKERIAEGMPVFGSCAGMILLADRVTDGAHDQSTFGGLDITVRRNAFGRQVDSFETDLEIPEVASTPLRAVFIRAPWVEQVGAAVEVLSSVVDKKGVTHPVAVRQGSLLATSFHPELTSDNRIHRYFVEQICHSFQK